jgi:hypothetical protein
LLPEPPERLVARNTGMGQVTLTWTPPPCCDNLGGDAATSYKVYHSTSGRAFDNGTVTRAPGLTMDNLPPGSLHFFRVTALNDGGESFPTPVVAVRTPLPGEQVDLLIVDGFDRLDQTAMLPQAEPTVWAGTARRMFLERMNRYDYAVVHGQALDACGLSFDGAVNEAVEEGDLILGDYPALDWFVGEDSVADAALSDIERARLATYLSAGGRLLLSGAEIGYDLVEMGRDPSFFQNYLKASYAGDDAGTYQFSGLTDTFLDGISGRFDDSTAGIYDVGYPDRLASAGDSRLVLQYSGGTGGGAALAYEGDYRLVYVGFPLEAVTEPSVRSALICSAADWLLQNQPAPSSGRPRTINPGFEQGLGQSAWQAASSSSAPPFYSRQDLPAYVQPKGGDWLAWLGNYTPGISATTALTQAIGLPPGEPTATVTLNWFVHGEGGTPSSYDLLTAGLYDLNGMLLSELLTLRSDAPARLPGRRFRSPFTPCQPTPPFSWMTSASKPKARRPATNFGPCGWMPTMWASRIASRSMSWSRRPRPAILTLSWFRFGEEATPTTPRSSTPGPRMQRLALTHWPTSSSAHTQPRLRSTPGRQRWPSGVAVCRPAHLAIPLTCTGLAPPAATTG